MNTKFKSPLFWVSMVSIILAAGGVSFETLTSWDLLWDAVLRIISNPVAITSCVIAGWGVWSDNGVKK